MTMNDQDQDQDQYQNQEQEQEQEQFMDIDDEASSLFTLNSEYQKQKELIRFSNRQISDEIVNAYEENKNLINDIKTSDPLTNVITYADNDGVMSKHEYLELNKKIVSDDNLSAFYPFPNNEVPYSTWTLYKIARKIDNLLDQSMISIADSIYFSSAEKGGSLLDDKFYLSFILRPYLVSLLKTNKDYRELILKEKVSSFLPEYDYSGTLETSAINLHKNIEENNEARLEHEKETIKFLEKEKLKKDGQKKYDKIIPCAEICNFLLSNSEKSKERNDPYITIYKQFLQFYIQVLRKFDENVKTDEQYKEQIEKEVSSAYGKDISSHKNKDEIIQNYLCKILRKSSKTSKQYEFCSIIQKAIQNLLIENEILLSRNQWLELFNHTPDKFQQEISKIFIEYSQPKWTHFQLACPSDFTNLQPFLKHQKLCQYLFTPESPMRGILIWHTVGAGKTCLAIENLSYSWEGFYNVLWITRKTLKNVPLENMFGKLKGNSAMDICHKRAREEFSDASSPIRTSYNNKPAVMYPTLFTNYADWNAYSRSKLKSNKVGFKNANKSDYKNENNKQTRILDYNIYGRTLVSEGKNPTSKRMREWGMADQYTNGSDFLRKTVIGFDEAHNLFNQDLPKQEKNAIDKMLPQICQNIWHSYVVSKENSCRVLLLTATPFTQADNPESFFKLINLMLPPKGYIELDQNQNPNPLLYPENRQYIGYFPVTLEQIREKYLFLINKDKNWIVANREPSPLWSQEEKHIYYELLEKTKGLISYFDFSNNPNYFPLKIYTQPIGVPLKKLQCAKLFEKLKITDLTINENFKMKCSKLLGKSPDDCSRIYRCVNSNINGSCNNENNLCKTPNNTNVTITKPKKNNTKKLKKQTPTLLDEWYPNCPITKKSTRSQIIDYNLNEIILGKKKEIPKNVAFPFETILQNENLKNLSKEELNYIRGLENGIFDFDSSINQEINNVNNMSFTNSIETNKNIIKGMKELEKNCNKYEELFNQIDFLDKQDFQNYGRLFKYVIFTDPNDFNKNQGIPWLCSTAFLYGYKMHSLSVQNSTVEIESDSDEDDKPKKTKKVALVSVSKPNEKFYNTYNKEIYYPQRHKSTTNYNVLTLTSSKLKGSMFFTNPNSENLYQTPKGLTAEQKTEYESNIKDSYIQSIVNAFNSESNIYGEQFRFLFIDSTFKEGISTRNARHYFLLDPPKSKSSLDQALGRVARLCNTDLPYGLLNKKTEIFEPGWQVHIHPLFSYIPMTGDIVHSIITSQDNANENLKLTQTLISIAQLNSIDYILNSPTTNEETQYYELDAKYYAHKERNFGNHPADQRGAKEYQKSNHNKTYRKRYINALNQICLDLNIP